MINTIKCFWLIILSSWFFELFLLTILGCIHAHKYENHTKHYKHSCNPHQCGGQPVVRRTSLGSCKARCCSSVHCQVRSKIIKIRIAYRLISGWWSLETKNNFCNTKRCKKKSVVYNVYRFKPKTIPNAFD